MEAGSYHTFYRQRRNAQEIVLRQGLALLKALAAGTRNGTGVNQWDEDTLDQYILKLGQIQDIAYLYILGARGAVIHSTGTRPLHGKGPRSGGPDLDADVQTRLIQGRNGTEIYEITRKRVFLWDDSRYQVRAGQHPTGVTAVIGMRMAAFDEARRADLHHAFIMTVIVLALGAGAIYFIEDQPLPPVTLAPGKTLKQIEQEMILKTLEECNGNRTWAAKTLGISRRTLQLKLKEYGINP